MSNPLETNFRDQQFLSSYPLNKLTALTYFSQSGFYDPQCNNEIVRMQQLDYKALEYAMSCDL